jgi:hypothetical protein
MSGHSLPTNKIEEKGGEIKTEAGAELCQAQVQVGLAVMHELSLLVKLKNCASYNRISRY